MTEPQGQRGAVGAEGANDDRRQSRLVIRCKVFAGFVSGEYGILIELGDQRLFTFAPKSRVVVEEEKVVGGEYTPGELIVPLLAEGDDYVTIRLPQQTVSTGDSINVPRDLVMSS